jgi:hypothetical protein
LKYANVLILICFTLLLAYDYFPNISQVVAVPKTVLIFTIPGLFLISRILNRKSSVDIKAAFKEQVLFTFYALFLIGLFTILGGKSSVGISFSNGIFWLVLFVSLIETSMVWKKVNSSKTVSS